MVFHSAVIPYTRTYTPVCACRNRRGSQPEKAVHNLERNRKSAVRSREKKRRVMRDLKLREEALESDNRRKEVCVGGC